MSHAAPPTHDMALIATSSATFHIDRHEVTVGQFRQFVSATGFKTKAETDGGGFQYLGGWQRMTGWTWAAPYGAPARDDEPAAHVTWHEAKAEITTFHPGPALATEQRDGPSLSVFCPEND